MNHRFILKICVLVTLVIIIALLGSFHHQLFKGKTQVKTCTPSSQQSNLEFITASNPEPVSAEPSTPAEPITPAVLATSVASLQESTGCACASSGILNHSRAPLMNNVVATPENRCMLTKCASECRARTQYEPNLCNLCMLRVCSQKV